MRILMLALMLQLPALARRQGPTSACQSNLKNLASALEMWADDHRGGYPGQLDQLVPIYLKEIPRCPAAGRDTYSTNYRRWRHPDDFGLCCSGSNHLRVMGANLPAYTSCAGLVAWQARQCTPDPCRADLVRLGQALQAYRHRHGHYPDKLTHLLPDQLSSLPSCSAGSFVYRGGGEISCPAEAHLTSGLDFYQPAWTPDTGLTSRPLRPLRSPIRSSSENQLGLLAILVLLWIAGMLRLSRRLKRAHEGWPTT